MGANKLPERMIGRKCTINEAGAARYSEPPAGTDGTIKAVSWYADGTVEYIVYFGGAGEWDWYTDQQVEVEGGDT